LQLEVTDSAASDSALSPSRREAYDIYLRGEHALDRGDQHGFEEAVVSFRSALQHDPTFADAAEALSSALESLVEWHFVEPRSGSQQVREAAQLALRLNPRSAGAHAVLGGNITVYDWDWPRAEQELNAALALSAKDADVATFAAMHSVAVGEWDRALQLLDTAISDDPLNPELLNAQSMTLARLGRWSEAEDVARRILEISSTSSWNRYWLSVVLLMQGKSEDALQEAKQETATVYRLAAIGMACDALGRHAESDAALRELEAGQLLGRHMRIAEVYAVRGDLAEAMEWLEKAYDAKDASLYYLKGHPPFRNLVSDPRYKAFLRKMNLPE
jgi:tetratricopeptide (TPR) repeat protein